MDNIAGSPVEGGNFYGRAEVVAHLRGILEHDDILLLGPRRIGKTSTARAVMTAVRNEGWRALEINVAACTNERDFIAKLEAALKPELASFSEKARSLAGDAFDKITGRIKSIKIPIPGAGSFGVDIGEADAEEWTVVASDVLRLISHAEERWMIYIDELPIMLFNIIRNDKQSGVQRVRRFLDWFRNDVRALPDVRRVRWLVSGSVGLDTLVQEHGMADTINSMRHQGLTAYKDEVAVAMLAELAESYKIELSDVDARHIVAAVQWPQPYYLQMAFHHLRALICEYPDDSPASLIDQAMEIMVQPGGDNDFHHWEIRLSIQLGRADADIAMALLNMAARDPLGARAENLLDAVQERMPGSTAEEAKRAFIRLRDILIRDAYWWADETSGVKRYRFRLEPLRRWWIRRDTL
ncbi:MAG: ATP-binding protein [Gallionella sp.]|nr:ATP-binding protein [Gallionella sp.]MDP1941062.1 ATP-binding protein [Gallionella sp.]